VADRAAFQHPIVELSLPGLGLRARHALELEWNWPMGHAANLPKTI
jgi:hypothetical protein